MSSRKPPEAKRTSQPRLRVLAGPNGSGKSTIKLELKPQWIGVFINADEIERTLRESGGRLDLKTLGISAPSHTVLARIEAHLRENAFAQKLGMARLLGHLQVDGALTLQVPGPYDSYLASVLADAIRRELMAEGQTFTFETVMSSRDKVDFMKEAKALGYRVYLYFVATKDPAINVERVKRRVQQGGHPVPVDRIRSRYTRSIALLKEAADVANRAYVFDNSGDKHKLLVQVIDGESMEIEAGNLPRWFTETGLWQAFAEP